MVVARKLYDGKFDDDDDDFPDVVYEGRRPIRVMGSDFVNRHKEKGLSKWAQRPTDGGPIDIIFKNRSETLIDS